MSRYCHICGQAHTTSACPDAMSNELDIEAWQRWVRATMQGMVEKDAEIARLTAELAKCREDAGRLVPHAKWLRECGLELAHDGHYGWANTLTMAADAIEAARSKP